MLICSVYSENASAIDSTEWTIKLLADENTFVDSANVASVENGAVGRWTDAKTGDNFDANVSQSCTLRSVTNNSVQFRALEFVSDSNNSGVFRYFTSSISASFDNWFGLTNNTLFMVRKQTGLTTGSSIVWNGTSGTFNIHSTWVDNNIYYDNGSSSVRCQALSAATTNWEILEFFRDDEYIEIRKNGSIIGQLNGAGNPFVAGQGTLAISNNITAQCYAYLNVNYSMSDEDRAQVRAELAARVGITL